MTMRLMNVTAKLGALAVVVTFATSTSQPAMAGKAAFVCNEALLFCKYHDWEDTYPSFAACLEGEGWRCSGGDYKAEPRKMSTALWINQKKTVA
jgi:hypothetical protein